MAGIDYSFGSSSGALNLDCRVKDFWEPKKKTFCFSEEIKIPWRFDCTLKTGVSVFPYPTSLHSAYSQYSLDMPKDGQFQKIGFSIGQEMLTLKIPLINPDGTRNEELPWDQTVTGKRCIKWEHCVYSYRINLLIVINPPPAGPPPVEHDWSGFLSGELPSLGKRR